jgi:hypothetical protein
MNKDKVVTWLDNCRSTSSEFFKTLNIFYTSYIKPVLMFFVPFWAWLAPRYVSLYQKMAYKDGVHVASRGAAALATLSAGTVLALYVNLWYIIPGVFTFTYDAVAYNAFSYKTEKLYFSSPQWIEDNGGDGDRVLSVFSCETRHCNLDSSTEYRFRDSIYLNAVKWVTRFEPYDPADVAGILLSELNYCTATAYGKRFKPFDWYPYIYDVECTLLPPNDVTVNPTVMN